jgi:glycosyltransferase involved in cell wall biosynthesis
MEMAYSRLAQQRLNRTIAEYHPDLIYERFAFFNLAGTRVALRHRIPMILEVNELSGLDRVRGQTFRNLARQRESMALCHANLISAVSPVLSRMAVEQRGTEQGVVTVPNGVFRTWIEKNYAEHDRITLRRQIGIPDTALVLGFMGGLVPWHGFDFLLDLFTRLAGELPQLWLMLVGNGPLMPRLQAVAQSPAMQGRLKLIGARPYWQTRACVDLFDVAVIPHANEFRSPIKLFEYMGAGRAIVAAASEPIASVVRHGQEALLFKPMDQTDALGALRLALSNPDLRLSLGAQARQKALDSCLWEHRANAILNAVRSRIVISNQ